MIDVCSCCTNRGCACSCKPQGRTFRAGPFEWLQTVEREISGRRLGLYITRFFLEEECQPRTNAGHDFVFRKRKFELKTGTEHSTQGVFLFEQIRPQQEWDAVACIGIAVNGIEFFVFPRGFIEKGIAAWRRKGDSFVTPQHGGAKRRGRGTSQPDTFWIWTKPQWASLLAPYRTKFGPGGWSGRHFKELLGRLS